MMRLMQPHCHAAHTVALTALAAAQGIVPLLPIGNFRANDGRPEDAPHWQLTEARAREMAAALTARAQAGNPLLVDFEHQSLHTASNGQRAPAAAWCSQFEVRDAHLCSVNTQFVGETLALLRSSQYRHVSPVFKYAPGTGEVLAIKCAAFTNLPGLDGLTVAALKTLSLASPSVIPPPPTGAVMKPLITMLCALFKLPVDTTEEALMPHVAALQAQLGGEGASAVAVLRAKAEAKPDPALYVPMDAHKQVADSLAALRAQNQAREVDDLVKPALADGRLLPQMEDWARNLGTSNAAALKAYLDTAKPLTALSGTQTGGKPPQGTGTGKPLTEDEVAMCRMTGLDEAAFMKQRDAA
jgi:phage I-like protein